ncbi:ester cyclase [Undibacterium sp. Di26W]|uniref:ester cyclase n=1 Tax=Undibacterium sp. Di26W TaxID=3413035 RepID=UPI003BF12EC4
MNSASLLEQNKQLIRRLYEDCFNTGNLDLANELVSADFSSNRGERGQAEFAANISGLRKAFPNVHFVIEDLFGEADRIAVRWSFTAIHHGPFAGVPATGKAVTQHGNVIYQISNGRISHAWVQIDRLGLMQQIGAQA